MDVTGLQNGPVKTIPAPRFRNQKPKPDPHYSAAAERAKDAARRLISAGIIDAEGRAAELNGSYLGVSTDIRRVVNQEFEAFVAGCIEARRSFAIETTLSKGGASVTV